MWSSELRFPTTGDHILRFILHSKKKSHPSFWALGMWHVTYILEKWKSTFVSKFTAIQFLYMNYDPKEVDRLKKMSKYHCSIFIKKTKKTLDRNHKYLALNLYEWSQVQNEHVCCMEVRVHLLSTAAHAHTSGILCTSSPNVLIFILI